MLSRNSVVSDNLVKEYDHLYKFVMVGDPSVGKSSILLRFADDLFNENYYSTIGVDFRFKTLMLEDKYIKLQIWDTAGQEKFRCLTNAYYKGANAIMMVFDVTSRSSFENLEDWMSQISQYVDTNPLIMILGAKSDLTLMQAVSYEEMEQFASSKGCPFYLVSAKNDSNVFEAFVDSVGRVMEKVPASKPRQSVLNIGDALSKKKDSVMDTCCF